MLTYPLSLSPSVVYIGFDQTMYTASERDLSVMVCVEVKQGTLGIPVDLSLTTHSENALGIYTCTHTCTYIYFC